MEPHGALWIHPPFHTHHSTSCTSEACLKVGGEVSKKGPLPLPSLRSFAVQQDEKGEDRRLSVGPSLRTPGPLHEVQESALRQPIPHPITPPLDVPLSPKWSEFLWASSLPSGAPGDLLAPEGRVCHQPWVYVLHSLGQGISKHL